MCVGECVSYDSMTILWNSLFSFKTELYSFIQSCKLNYRSFFDTSFFACCLCPKGTNVVRRKSRIPRERCILRCNSNYAGFWIFTHIKLLVTQCSNQIRCLSVMEMGLFFFSTLFLSHTHKYCWMKLHFEVE